MAEAALPLAGIRVVEFTHMVMGPTCGMILADLGADVIKVEPVGGDNTRKLLGSGAGFFPMFNRNKKSLAVDTKDARGREIVLKLVATADVFSENFKPGTMAKLGFDYAALSKLNPGLIYVSHKGFLPGPYEHRTALDEVVQMMGGLAYMTGPEGRPLRAGSSVNDIMGGMFGAIGALAALHERTQTGRGQAGSGRAVREQRAAGRAAHDAGFGHRQAGGADAEPRRRMGDLRRVHRQERRADLPRGRLRYAVVDLLRCVRLRRPAGRCAAGDQQRPRAGPRLDDAAAARTPGIERGADLAARCSSATACRTRRSRGRRTCSTIRT